MSARGSSAARSNTGRSAPGKTFDPEAMTMDIEKAEPKTAFYACDVRGVGESRPDTCGVDQFLKPYGNDYFYAVHGLMLDRPYAGQKTHDLLCVLDAVQAQKVVLFAERDACSVAFEW